MSLAEDGGDGRFLQLPALPTDQYITSLDSNKDEKSGPLTSQICANP